MIQEVGFIFWGLFLVFGAVIVLYVIWIYLVEQRGDDE